MDELKAIPVDEFFFGNPLKALLRSSKVMLMKLLYITLSIVIGIIAWDSYLPMAIFIPFLWSTAPTKKTAWMIGFCYHLAASRGLIFGVPVFFSSGVFYGYFLWLVAGVIQSLPYLVCAYVKNRYLAILLLLISLILPPIGIIGWANPLTAAGVIFPGTGFAGIVLTILLIWVMIWFSKNNKSLLGVWAAFVILFPLVIGPNVTSKMQIKGSTTNFMGNPGNIAEKFQRDYQKFHDTYNQYSETEFKTLLLPEATAGLWFDSTKHLWSGWQKHLKKDQTVVLSTLLPESNKGLETYNVLIEMNQKDFKVLYKARQSVPLGMWKPWAKENVLTSWFSDPVFEISGKKATAIICYEAYLTWPVLHSFLAGDPEVILFVANHW